MYPACILHVSRMSPSYQIHKSVWMNDYLRYMYSHHVSRMYPECILITPLQIHVSRMYPACILHLGYVPLKIHDEIHVSHHVSRMYPECILITLPDTLSRIYL